MSSSGAALDRVSALICALRVSQGGVRKLRLIVNYVPIDTDGADAVHNATPKAPQKPKEEESKGITIDVDEPAPKTTYRAGRSYMSFERFTNLFDGLSHATLSSSKTGISTGPRINITKFHYASGVVSTYQTGASIVDPVHERLTTIGRLDLSVPAEPNVRIVIRLQQVEHVEFTPSVSPLYVTLSESWSYAYKSTYMYTLDKRVIGVDKQDACRCDPDMHVTLELLSTSPSLQIKSDTTNALNLLGKVLDLVGRFDSNGDKRDLSAIVEYTHEPHLKLAKKKTTPTITKKKRTRKRKTKPATSADTDDNKDDDKPKWKRKRKPKPNTTAGDTPKPKPKEKKKNKKEVEPPPEIVMATSVDDIECVEGLVVAM